MSLKWSSRIFTYLFVRNSILLFLPCLSEPIAMILLNLSTGSQDTPCRHTLSTIRRRALAYLARRGKTISGASEFTVREACLRTKRRFVRGAFLTGVRGCANGDLIAFHAAAEARKSGTRTTSSNRDTRTCRTIGLCLQTACRYRRSIFPTTFCQLSRSAQYKSTQFMRVRASELRLSCETALLLTPARAGYPKTHKANEAS